MIDAFSDEFKNNNSDIEIFGEKFEKKIYYPSFLNGNIIEGKNIVIVYNGMKLIQRPAKFVDFIINIKKKYGFKKLIYLQGVSDPYLIPALVYLGIDVFDDIYIRSESLKHIKYAFTGKTRVDYDPLKENIEFIHSILDSLYDSIKNGTLRDVVEKIGISGKALELIRITDLKYNNEYSLIFPSRTPYIQANSIESLNRPDINSYRNAVSVYEKPKGRDIALLLPCSAKKPYSISKTHMKIISEISNYRKYLHELIVTSPVGLVPRELENGYPARFYDIPVIWIWYEDEKIMMKSLISSYIKNNNYKKIVAYIPEDLLFLKDVLPEDAVIIAGRVTDDKNLNILKKELDKIINSETTNGNKLEDYKSILKFHFGN